MFVEEFVREKKEEKVECLLIGILLMELEYSYVFGYYVDINKNEVYFYILIWMDVYYICIVLGK